MERYDSYKDSGVDWIGEIPSHWFFVGTNKVYNDLGTGTTPTSDNTEYYSDNGYHWITTTDLNEGIMYDTLSKITEKSVEDYPNLRLYPSGSIYISMYGGRIGKLGVSTFDSYCNQSVCVLPKNDDIIVKFYYYWFLGFQEFVKGMGRGGGQPNINKDMIKSFPTVKIPLPEQQQIVSFLDTKTSLIDSLIEKTQRKIELLKEKRTSLINGVVTKGLNPNVEMKDSGVEWIGEIPSHWGCFEFKFVINLLTDFESNGSFKSVKENVKVLDDIGPVWYVRMTDLENNNIRNDECKYCDFDTYEFLHKTKLDGGELLITKRGEIGKVYIFPNDSGISTLGPNSYLLKLDESKVSPNFLFYFYKSDFGQITLKLMDKSTTIGSIYKDDLKNSKVIIPPLSEQQQIVDYLDEYTQRIDKTISIEEKRIELLKEYRQSLISEVVTGKRKVVE